MTRPSRLRLPSLPPLRLPACLLLASLFYAAPALPQEEVPCDYFLGLYATPVAHRVGDLVTVFISESTRASHQAARSHDRQTDTRVGPGAGLLEFLPFVGHGGSSQSASQAGTTRQETLQTSLTARVVAITPAGNLVLEGERNVQVNGDLHRLTLRGEARPQDLSSGNTISSRDLAQVEIFYEGSDPARPSRREGLLNWVLNLLF